MPKPSDEAAPPARDRARSVRVVAARRFAVAAEKCAARGAALAALGDRLADLEGDGAAVDYSLALAAEELREALGAVDQLSMLRCELLTGPTRFTGGI
jgi:hypothetical protein